MKFTIEQIAICPKDPSKAKQLLKDMGAVDWSEDRVIAKGKVLIINQKIQQIYLLTMT